MSETVIASVSRNSLQRWQMEVETSESDFYPICAVPTISDEPPLWFIEDELRIAEKMYHMNRKLHPALKTDVVHITLFKGVWFEA